MQPLALLIVLLNNFAWRHTLTAQNCRASVRLQHWGNLITAVFLIHFFLLIFATWLIETRFSLFWNMFYHSCRRWKRWILHILGDITWKLAVRKINKLKKKNWENIHPEVILQKGYYQMLKFSGKHPYQSLFFNEVTHYRPKL